VVAQPKSSAATCAALLLAGCAAATSGPPQSTWRDQVQAQLATSWSGSSNNEVRALIPYDSITLERGPCAAPCEEMRVTFHRAGPALLETDHFTEAAKQTRSASVQLRDYARLAQFADVVIGSVAPGEYRAAWTHGAPVRITVTGRGGTWSVTDFGKVAPAEAWALEQAIDGLRGAVHWRDPVAAAVVARAADR
jgi:hypothetical protein